MKNIVILIITAFLSTSSSLAFEYKDGDLVFQVSGNSEFSKAITSATGALDSISFIHVGIAFLNEKGETNIIEASPEAGVRIVPLGEFLSSSSILKGNPGVVVKRVAVPIGTHDIIKRALSFIGESYDWYYLPDNGMMYCSELVYDSYFNSAGERIFKSAPMNFRAKDGSMPVFWVELYKQLGIDVPEGIPGTNPNDIAKDPQLIEVFRYF